MPDSIRRDAVFAASSMTDGGAFRITVTDVVDNPNDCESEDDGGGQTGSNSLPDCLLECGPSLFYSLLRGVSGGG